MRHIEPVGVMSLGPGVQIEGSSRWSREKRTEGGKPTVDRIPPFLADEHESLVSRVPVGYQPTQDEAEAASPPLVLPT